MELHRTVVVPLVVVMACSTSSNGGGEATSGTGGNGTSFGGWNSGGYVQGVGGSGVGQGGTAVASTTGVTGGAVVAGGATYAGGATTTSSTQTSGGTSPSGGTSGTRATGGGQNRAGASTTGGTTSGGGTTSSGSANVAGSAGAIGGTKSSGGTNASGGTKSIGGANAAGSAGTIGGTKSSGGTSASGGTKSSGTAGTSVVGTRPYKGVANSPASQLAALGASWCYNWGTTAKSTDCADPLFVPMIWGSNDVAGAIKSIGNAGYTTVLGFNEPNKTDQANMTVADAIALWPTVTSSPNIRVGSPAVSDDGRSWLVDFMTEVKAKGLRVDFIAMHWYGWNAGSCVAGQLEGAVNWASQWGLPIWITEFGCMGSSNPDEQTLLKFFNDAIPMLNKHPLVERYAWYPWNTYNELYKNDVMTNLGKAFAAAPQYR
jgi:hypothetical protein